MSSELPPNLRQAFELIGYGCLPTLSQAGCTLVVHVDRQTIDDCRGAPHDIRLELHEVGGCPVIRMAVRVLIADPLTMDCYLNIQDAYMVEMIESLATQERLVTMWYDERLRPVRASAVTWHDTNRNTAREIIDRARQLVAETGGGDWEAARAAVMAANPIG